MLPERRFFLFVEVRLVHFYGKSCSCVVFFREPARFVKGLSREVVDVGKKILRPLNKVQQKAVFR